MCGLGSLEEVTGVDAGFDFTIIGLDKLMCFLCSSLVDRRTGGDKRWFCADMSPLEMGLS